DLNLPTLGGGRFMTELEAIDPTAAARTIIMSGTPRSAVDPTLLRSIASRFVEKPVTVAVLDRLIREIVTSA
ncbi:hypothetical protein ACEV85_23425, partial [Vibrio parahaemolyticus]